MRTRISLALGGAVLLALIALPLQAHPGKGHGGHGGQGNAGHGGHGGAGHGGVGGGGQGGTGHGPGSCSADRCVVEAAIDQACPCDAAANHGQYVRCVAREVKQLAADGMLGRSCRGKAVSCAARSACGHADRLTCFVPTDQCDVATHTCVGAPTVTCTVNLDCGSQCGVMRSVADCTAAGGTVDTTRSCCSAGCASASGAFVN